MIDLSTNPIQKAFIFSPCKYTGYYGGVGNGKTTAGIVKGYLLSEGFPGNFGLIGRKTYTELRDTTQKEFLDLVRLRNGGSLEPGPVLKQYIKGENILEFRNGSKVIFRYLDEMEKILSLNLGWFYIDQAEEVGEDVWNHLQGRLRYWNPEKVKSWLADYSDYSRKYWGKKTYPTHFAFITGNPHPGWVKRIFKDNPPSKEYKLFEASSAQNAANLPEGFIESLRESYSEEYAQRYIDGRWDAFGGQIYKTFSETTHCIPSFEIPSHWKRIISLDHGYTNPTCVLWGAVDEVGNLFIYKEHYKANMKVSEHAQIIKEKCQNEPVERFEGKIRIWADPSTRGKQGVTGRSIMEEYRRLGLALAAANNHVEAGIMRVNELMALDPNHEHPIKHKKMAPHLYIFKRECPNLISELKEYQWEKTIGDKNRSEKPRKKDDHACDALRYMVMTYFTNSQKQKESVNIVDKFRNYMTNFIKDIPDSKELEYTRYGE